MSAQNRELTVIETTAEDSSSADKLTELLPTPFARVSAESLQATIPTHGACYSDSRLELVLDAERQLVTLVRCADATVLSRRLDATFTRQTAYASAFVGAELLSILRELEAIHARAATGHVDDGDDDDDRAQLPSSTSPRPGATGPSTPPAIGGPESRQPLPSHRSDWKLRLAAAGEWSALGDPFDGLLRPNIGFGLARVSEHGAWTLGLHAGLGTSAVRIARVGEQLSLRRHDGQLRLGYRARIGAGAALQLGGFAAARASWTTARYEAGQAQEVSDVLHVRMGAIVGLEADWALTADLAVFALAALELAVGRSDYRVADVSWVQDPVNVLWLGLGISAELALW